MFCKKSKSGYKKIEKGILMKPLVHGKRTLLIETNLKKGSEHKLHTHPYEQTGYLVSGRLTLCLPMRWKGQSIFPYPSPRST